MGTFEILALRSWKISACHITAEKDTILCNSKYKAFWFPVQTFHFSTIWTGITALYFYFLTISSLLSDFFLFYFCVTSPT